MSPSTPAIPALLPTAPEALRSANSTRLERVTTGVVSAAVLVSAVVYCGASLVLSSQVPLIQFAFEPVVGMACAFGLLFAFGKFRWAPAITLVCVAGTVAIASFLVYRGMLGQVQVAGQSQGWSLLPWLGGRLAAAALLAGLAGWNVVSRDARARKSFIHGCIASIPLVISLGGCYFVWNARSSAQSTAISNAPSAAPGSATTPSPVSGNISGIIGAPGVPASNAGMPGWVSTGLLTFLGIAAGASLCAAGHFFIRAFEIGSDVAEGRNPDAGVGVNA